VMGIAAAEDPVVCASLVASEIKRLLDQESVRDKQTGIARRARPGDIAILFRSRTSHREVEHELELLGIPTYVYKGLGFFDADEVRDLSALIRFLANPASDLRAAAFLRSRFIRLSDEALVRLAPRLAAALIAATPPEQLHALADDDRRALEAARVHIPEWIARVDRVPPADLIERILPDTAYAYELRGPRAAQAWENVKKMRGLIRRIQNRGYATLARIADHLESLTAGDESNAVLEAIDAVNLMTVHAAKGLEFPVVFVVNLARGASGPPKPMRVAGDDVSVGPFVSETDDEEKLREREETKRLLYVALTRARDRLYLASLVKNGACVPGRGSLADVMPESLRGLFNQAACAPIGESLEWQAASGRTFELRVCAERSASTRSAEPDGPARTADESRREQWLAETELEIVREAVSERANGWVAPREGHPPESQAALTGTLVHRLFQHADTVNGDADVEMVSRARALLRPEELALAVDATAVCDDAVRVFLAIRERLDVKELLQIGERLYEVPFSLRVSDNPGRIVRGSIDCLVRRPDGTLVVVEIKTGRPRPEHNAQLEVYIRAAQELSPDARVSGVLIYSEVGSRKSEVGG